jgi:predicted permease
MWRWTLFDVLLQDLRYALRTLAKSPGFAVTAILTLALGIGAGTAVFTVVDSVLLKPLSYRDSGQLVAVWERVGFLGAAWVEPNPRHADLWRKRTSSLSGITLLRHAALGLSLDETHPRLTGAVLSSPGLFDVLQVTPLLGRTFLPEDGVKGHDNVAILTWALWQNVFQADPNIIGKTIRLGDVPRQVIGVLPPAFHFPNRNALRAFTSKQTASSVPEPAVFLPMAFDLERYSWNGEYGNWVAVARLQPGHTIARAEAELNAIQDQVLQQMPAAQRDNGPNTLVASVQPLQEAVVGHSRAGLWFLMAAVLGLMLIACVNLANAQLGRALFRQREAAVRAALGAGRKRLIAGSLAENLLLAVLGGSAGVMLAAGGLHLFRRYALVDLPRLSEVHLNGAVLLFSAILTIGSSMLFGMLPALKLARTDPHAALQQSSARTLGSRHSHRLRAWLIGLQVFGSTLLLLMTGLFARSLLHLLHQDKGFETGRVAIAEVNLPPRTWDTDAGRIAFIDAVLANLRALPGVRSAGLVSAMPLEGESWIEGLRRADQPDRKASLVNLRWLSPGYFETTRARLIAGRFFEERDRTRNSIVLSEGEARALWPADGAVGGEVLLQGRKFTVIGIVADSRNASLKTAPPKMAYIHYGYRPPYSTIFMAQSAQTPDALLPEMRQAIWKHAPGVTIGRLKSMDTQLSDSLAAERFQTQLLLAFAAAALLLAMLGIYGVLSYSTAVRRQEIGVRMALGATRSRIFSLTLGEAGAPVFGGLAAGVIASLLVVRTIRGMLYGTQPIDTGVMAIVAGLFLAAAFLAAFLPARRAAALNPMEALRAE